VKAVRSRFGFISCPDIDGDVFFDLSAVYEAAAPSESGTANGGSAAAEAAPAQQPEPGVAAGAGSQRRAPLSVGDRVAFQLSLGSRPGRFVASRVRRLPAPAAAGGAAAAEPGPSGRGDAAAGAAGQAGGQRLLGLVAVAPRPASNVAWSGKLRAGLIRFLEPGDDGGGGGGRAQPGVRHVAFGLSDCVPAAAGSSSQQATPPQLRPGDAVVFSLAADAAIARRIAEAHPDGGRAAFWASHSAAGVAQLAAGEEARLPPGLRSQLAVLRMLAETEEVVAAVGQPPPSGG
jgi:hypothetical protein